MLECTIATTVDSTETKQENYLKTNPFNMNMHFIVLRLKVSISKLITYDNKINNLKSHTIHIA